MRALIVLLLVGSCTRAEKFYPDDPVSRDPAPLDASRATQRKIDDWYDLLTHTFKKLGQSAHGAEPIRARNIDTMDEAWEGAWYERRHYWRPMTTEQLLQGPGGKTPPATSGPLTVVRIKTEGITPGFTLVDSAKRTYFVKFDPPNNPEMTSAAEIISTKLFHALGYHVPDTYLFRFHPDRLRIGEGVTMRGKDGRARPMRPADLKRLLSTIHTEPNGEIRALASLRVPGQELGKFRYYGTRADDPNDFIPHEHRRELRGLRVFSAWLNHDDSRAINTFDALVEEKNVKYVRHYLMDFGSTLGSGTSRATSARSGNEYLFESRPAVLQFITLGAYIPRWERAHFRYFPSVGMIESKVYDPARWKPEYPNPAFDNMLDDDAFWAAKQLTAFTDEHIRAVVHLGEFSDEAAEEHLARVLIERRDKTVRAFLSRVLPLDRFRVEGGRLVFDDLGPKAGLGASEHAIAWSEFLNETETTLPLKMHSSPEVPAHACADRPRYFQAELRRSRDNARTLVYVRCRGGAHDLVGVERR